MKRLAAGFLAALALWWAWPDDQPIPSTWRRAWNPRTPRSSSTESVASLPEVSTDSVTIAPVDSLPVPNPFGTPPAPPARVAARTDLGVPPPPRVWRATGRVGERAAVLSNPDGRVLVVAAGSRVDSATVVSIGTDGVSLEDRAGRFVLRLP